MDVDDLYGLAPERFVPERDALVRELRRAGRRDEAAEVAALRKPSVAARAVNLLAREHKPQLRQLFEAGDALSEVQSQVLAGQADGRTLGEAAERERAAVSALVDAARELLVAEGQEPSATVLERVSDTLHAAALDDDARRPVEHGRSERELRHVGLGMGAGGAMPAPAKTKGGNRAAQAISPADSKRAEQAAARRQAEARKRAEAAEADARRQAERTAKALDAAERKRSRAAAALEEAETALKAARQAAKAAEEGHRRAAFSSRQPICVRDRLC